MNDYYISIHAYQRMKERLGWSRKTANRMVKKITEAGVSIATVPGYLGQWGKAKQLMGDDSQYLLYGRAIFVFRDNILVTVEHAASRETALTLADRKKERLRYHIYEAA